jgi:hypothetical protein
MEMKSKPKQHRQQIGRKEKIGRQEERKKLVVINSKD